MFIETNEGRLQNLYLLQDVIVVDNEDGTFSIGYLQVNGVIINEGIYNTREEAESDLEEIKSALLEEE